MYTTPVPIKQANLFVTGGAGTLGRAIARRRKEHGWTGKLTVYSTSPYKHAELRRDYPDIQFVQGDIRNVETLKMAMVGHDYVIHAAAVKYIPDSEWASIDTIDVNVYGSEMVCQAARETGMSHCLGISTDKACHPANAYGASKMLMEKVFQEYARSPGGTLFNLVRYGNVLESVGSVVEAWRKSVENGEAVKITDPNMTRFWLSPSQAVDHIVSALGIPQGRIFVPAMPALSIGKLLEYTISGMATEGNEHPLIQTIPMRPGEKLHETLITQEEADYTEQYPNHYILHPSTDKRIGKMSYPFTSASCAQLTRDELMELLND